MMTRTRNVDPSSLGRLRHQQLCPLLLARLHRPSVLCIDHRPCSASVSTSPPHTLPLTNPMRLIAVPLARARPGAQPVCTYLAQRLTPPKPNLPPSSSPADGTESKPATAETKQPPLSTRLLTKASQFWTALGRDGEDGKARAVFDWKRRTYNTGEKLMDRIEYEEWALKAVDPALGPRLDLAKVKEKANGKADGEVSDRGDPQRLMLVAPYQSMYAHPHADSDALTSRVSRCSRRTLQRHPFISTTPPTSSLQAASSTTSAPSHPRARRITAPAWSGASSACPSPSPLCWSPWCPTCPSSTSYGGHTAIGKVSGRPLTPCQSDVKPPADPFLYPLLLRPS